MDKLIFASLFALSIITPSLNGAALVSKFKGLSCAKKVVTLGATAGIGIFAHSKSKPTKPKHDGVTVRTNDWGESIYGIHTHIWVEHNTKPIGEAELTGACQVTELSLHDETSLKDWQKKYYRKELFNAVLHCASATKKCKDIYRAGNPKLYAELKAYAEANPLPAVK